MNKQLTVSLPEEQAENLRLKAEASRQSLSEYIRNQLNRRDLILTRIVREGEGEADQEVNAQNPEEIGQKIVKTVKLSQWGCKKPDDHYPIFGDRQCPICK